MYIYIYIYISVWENKLGRNKFYEWHFYQDLQFIH